MKKTLLLLILLTLPVQAETILIKRSGVRKSKAILDKKFVFMQSGQEEEAFSRAQTSSSRVNQPRIKEKSSENISSLNNRLIKIKEPVAPVILSKVKVPRSNKILTKIPSSSTVGSSTGKTSKPVQVNVYDEGNWNDYAEYETVEMDESLNVNAKIVNY